MKKIEQDGIEREYLTLHAVFNDKNELIFYCLDKINRNMNFSVIKDVTNTSSRVRYEKLHFTVSDKEGLDHLTAFLTGLMFALGDYSVVDTGIQIAKIINHARKDDEEIHKEEMKELLNTTF